MSKAAVLIQYLNERSEGEIKKEYKHGKLLSKSDLWRDIEHARKEGGKGSLRVALAAGRSQLYKKQADKLRKRLGGGKLPVGKESEKNGSEAETKEKDNE
jgi:hypothetical protein